MQLMKINRNIKLFFILRKRKMLKKFHQQKKYHQEYIARVLSVPLDFERSVSKEKIMLRPVDQKTIHRMFQSKALYNVLEKNIILPDNRPISTFGVHQVTILLDDFENPNDSPTRLELKVQVLLFVLRPAKKKKDEKKE